MHSYFSARDQVRVLVRSWLEDASNLHSWRSIIVVKRGKHPLATALYQGRISEGRALADFRQPTGAVNWRPTQFLLASDKVPELAQESEVLS